MGRKKAKMPLSEWLERYSGGETEARELAESLSLSDGTPALSDAPELCAAAEALLEAFKRFDEELEKVGFCG